MQFNLRPQINLNIRLKVVQHNVLHWAKARKCELANHYLELNPDIILLNSHGRGDNDLIKIFPYN